GAWVVGRWRGRRFERRRPVRRSWCGSLARRPTWLPLLSVAGPKSEVMSWLPRRARTVVRSADGSRRRSTFTKGCAETVAREAGVTPVMSVTGRAFLFRDSPVPGPMSNRAAQTATMRAAGRMLADIPRHARADHREHRGSAEEGQHTDDDHP